MTKLNKEELIALYGQAGFFVSEEDGIFLTASDNDDISEKLHALATLIESKLSDAKPVEQSFGTFCTVHNADKSKCDLHNLQCAFPSCCEIKKDKQ